MKDVVKAPPLPGTPAHQALLRGIIEAYADDERMLANRRPWIARARDMGRVVRSGPGYHRRRRCGDRRCERGRGAVPTVGQSGALAVASRPGEVDVLLESLEGFSICYHSLGTTNAHIIDDLKIVGGRLDRAAIVAAGLVQSLPTRTPEVIASEALRFALTVDTARRRGNVWQALRGLDELRWRIQELFAVTHDQPRPAHAIDTHASQSLKDKLGGLQARADLASIAQALANALDLITDDELTAGGFAVTEAQRAVLSALRRRTSHSH